MRKPVICTAGGMVVAAVIALLAANPGRGAGEPLLSPVNGHYYEAIPVAEGINWFDARAEAEKRSFMGLKGHLLTVTSGPENSFIVRNLREAVRGHWWLGGYQKPEGPEPRGGWCWVTGEPFTFTFWNDGEPNNQNNEAHLSYWETGTWNDAEGLELHSGYVVEYEPGPAPLPKPPRQPTAPSTRLVDHNLVLLSWVDVGVDGEFYEIERKTDTVPFVKIGTVSGVRTFADDTVVPRRTYVYRVRAVNRGGASSYSSEVRVTTGKGP